MEHTVKFQHIVLVIIASCSHNPDLKENDLAIKKDTLVSTGKPNWKSFFKKSPSVKDISSMKQNMATWLNSSQMQNLKKAARAQVILGQYEKAIQSYRTLIRNNPKETQLIIELAQVFLRKDKIDRCFATLREAKSNIDNNEQPKSDIIFQYKYTLGLTYIRKGNDTMGHSILSSLISKDPGFSPAYAAMSSSYLAKNKLQLSEFIAKRGLDRGKEDASLTNLLGVIAYRRGKYVEAKRWLKRSLKKNENFVPAIINRANIHIYNGELEAAEASLNKAIMLKPDSSKAYTVLGIVYRKQKRYKESESALLKSLELRPESAYSRYNLALLKYESLEEPGEALRLFHEVIQIDSSNSKLTEQARLSIETLKDGGRKGVF